MITENERVLKGVAALKAGDLEEFGRLLNASHASLRDDYEVSCRELDTLVELALEVPGVLGSRMTGAGFGGCTIALVPQPSLPAFQEHIHKHYTSAQGCSRRSCVPSRTWRRHHHRSRSSTILK